MIDIRVKEKTLKYRNALNKLITKTKYNFYVHNLNCNPETLDNYI